MEKDFLDELIIKNCNDLTFERDSIYFLIIKILTILNCKDNAGKKYIDEIPTNEIHQYIKDLEILYKIKELL